MTPPEAFNVLALIIAGISLGLSILQAVFNKRDMDKRARREDVDDLRRELDRMRAMHDNCERARTALFAENIELMRRLMRSDRAVEDQT